MPRHKILALAERIPFSRDVLGEIYTLTQTGVRPGGFVARRLADAYFGNDIPSAPTVLGAPPETSAASLPLGGAEILNRVLVEGPKHAMSMSLQKVCRAHSQRGMRFATPFIDPDLIDVAFRIPSRYKHNGRRNKLVLRHAVGTFMPEAFARRPKHPQRIREDQRFCDVLASIASPLLTPDRIRMRGIFDPQELQRLLNRPSGKPWPPEHAMRVWTAVLTEIWAETFLDGNGLPTRRANADAAQTVQQSPSRDRAAAA